MMYQAKKYHWESLIGRIALMLAIVAALAPPLVYLRLALGYQRASLAAEAETNAYLITGLINKNPDHWQYEKGRFAAILSHRLRGENSQEYRQLFANDMRIIAEDNDILPAPLISEEAEVFDAGAPVGFIRISRSLRSIIENTLLCGVFGILFGACLFFAMRIFPLRILKAAFSSLHQEKEQAIVTLNAIGDAVLTVDASCRIQALNPVAEEMTGFRSEEAGGKAAAEILDLATLADEDNTEILLKRCLQSGIRCTSSQPVILRHRGDGRQFHIEVTMAPLHDEKGVVSGVVIVLHDITARKLLEDALREKLVELEVIVRHAGVGIGFVKQGVIRETNAMAAEIVGLPMRELIGGKASLFFPSDAEYARFQEMALARFAEGRLIDVEYSLIHPDGKKIWLRLIGHGVKFVLGEERESVWIAQDVTRNREDRETLKHAMARAEEASRFKSEFLANMSHEIRTPMNAILGMGQLVLETELSPRQRDYLTVVQTSAEALLALLNDILDFSKIEAGQLTLEESPFGLPAVFDQVNSLLNIKAREKGLVLRFELAEGIPATLVGDALRLRQVLINLVGNAIKFTEQGGIVVAGEVRVQTADEVVLQFSVADTGIGITDAARDRIFEAFAQASSSVSRTHGGTGLGLSICRKLVGLLGGDIWLESEREKGSTFYFTARFGKGSAAHPDIIPVEKAVRSFDGRQIPPLRILVVEDNQFNKDLVKIILEKENHLVQTAMNGRKALEVLAESDIQVVFMDIKMPVMDGLTTTRLIRRCETTDNPQAREGRELIKALAAKIKGGHLPIVAMTANATLADRQECLVAGMDAYISKPFKEEEILWTINEMVGLRPGYSP
jgi:PAS domain S-box-containing protein